MNTTTSTPRATTVRLDGDVRKAVAAYARGSRRTFNGAVNYLLSVGLNKATAEGALASAPVELQGALASAPVELHTR